MEEAGRIRFQHDVALEARRLAVHEEAKRQLDADRAAHTLANLTPPIPLPDFLAVQDPPVQWVLEGLQPVGTRALLAAQAKSGKTTMVANLIKSLADSEPFLGDFLNHFDGTITLVDDELDERMLRRWLDRVGIAHPERIQVVPLRGRLGTFNITESNVRARWVEYLAGTDYLILDCLRPVLDACGLDESREAGVFLNAFDELMVEAGIDSALVVHHMGHSTARSRGDSRIMDWPDALWRLVREEPEEPSSARQFSAFGREVDVPPQTVHYREGVVVLAGQSAPVVKRSTEPLSWVIETWMNEARGEGKPGKWWEDHARIDQDAGLYAPSRDGVRESIQYLVQEGSLVQSREGRRVLLSLNSDHERVIEVVAGG
ncbi:AAA family ATPase [Corynebacterium mastitidis]|uniref:AAA family ATPase n=1 Tax=Corynebacterium mastitidis TaxID=161890 RepID=UPI0003751484|nr:AAA family ATPase [Corynebacterium mastitidis]